METLVAILIIGVLVAYFSPEIYSKILGAITVLISLLILFLRLFAINMAFDIGTDVAIDIAEDLNLVNIPNTFCPEKFNRTEYCIQFGLDKEELTGQAFINHEISDTVDLRFETKEKLLTCKLTKDKMCNFAEIKSAKDLKITLTDKFGATILTNRELRREIKIASKSIGLLSFIKKFRFK